MRRAILAIAISILVSGPAAAQICVPGCGECASAPSCFDLPVGSPCTKDGEPGTCVLNCPTEGNCCGCDPTVPPVPASSGSGIILLLAGLAAASMTMLWRRMRSRQAR